MRAEKSALVLDDRGLTVQIVTGTEVPSHLEDAYLEATGGTTDTVTPPATDGGAAGAPQTTEPAAKKRASSKRKAGSATRSSRGPA